MVICNLYPHSRMRCRKNPLALAVIQNLGRKFNRRTSGFHQFQGFPCRKFIALRNDQTPVQAVIALNQTDNFIFPEISGDLIILPLFQGIAVIKSGGIFPVTDLAELLQINRQTFHIAVDIVKTSINCLPICIRHTRDIIFRFYPAFNFKTADSCRT